MSMLEQVEQQVKQLSKADQEALREWLDNLLEDELVFTDEFKARIESAEQHVRQGKYRVKHP